MRSYEYKCHCGYSMSKEEEELILVRCPDCGAVIAMSSKENNPPRQEDFDKMIDATFEIMADGGVTFSGAR